MGEIYEGRYVSGMVAGLKMQELIDRTIEEIEAGKCHVFLGDYLGVNPDDPSDTWDLHTEYPENKNASAPSFAYILQDVIVIE